MNIQEMQKLFMQDAQKLGDYQLMSKTELANGYCDAEEAAVAARAQGNEALAALYEDTRSQYYSALMLRYWYKIFEWAQNSSSLHLELTDFVDWLSDSLYVAFYYRLWRYEFEATVKYGKFIDWKYDENGEVCEVLCTYDEKTLSGSGFNERKPNGRIHFVDAATCVPATFNLFEPLILDSVVSSETFKERLNPNSWIPSSFFNITISL